MGTTGTGYRWLVLLVCICVSSLANQADAQSHTVILQHVSLDEVLIQLADSTQINLAYDSELVQGITVYCVDRPQDIEATLRCILRDTGLDYIITSSGTYVIVRSTQEEPIYGHIRGVVLDSESGDPLPYAGVFLADAGLGTAANNQGLFSFSSLPPGEHRVVLSYLGYETRVDSIHITAGKDNRHQFYLDPQPVLSTPVLITGLQHRSPSHILGTGETHLTEEDERMTFTGRGGWTGVAANLTGTALQEPWADLHIQGGASSEQIVYLDGIPIRNPVTLGRLLGAFSPLAIDRLTIHKAGFNAIHGSTLSASIDAKQALSNPDRHIAAFQIDPLSLNARLQYRTGLDGGPSIAAMIAGRTSFWNLMQDPVINQMLDEWNMVDPYLTPLRYASTSGYEISPYENELDFRDLHSAARIQINPFHWISGAFYHGSSTAESMSLVTSNSALSTPYSRDNYHWETTGGRVGYQGFLGSTFLGSISVYHVEQAFSHGYTMPFVLHGDAQPHPGIPPLESEDRNRLIETAVEATVDASIGRRHQLSSSLAFIRTENHVQLGNAFFREVDYNTSQWRVAGHVQNDISLSRHAQLELGLRYTLVEGHQELYTEPRMGLRYDGWTSIIGDYAFRIAAGVYRQFVNEVELSSTGPMGILPFVRFWVPAGVTDGPPLAYHLAGEVLWQPHPSWRVDLESYYKWQPRVMVLDYEELKHLFQSDIEMITDDSFLAAASGEQFGVDVRAHYDHPRFRSMFGYSYVHAVQHIPGRFEDRPQPVPWEQPHRLSFNNQFLITSDLSISINARGIWGRSWAYRRGYYDFLEPLIEEGFGYLLPIDPRDPGSDKLETFYQLDAGIGYGLNVGTGRVYVSGKVMNVLDRRNELDRTIVGLGDDMYVHSRRHPGRQFVFSIRLDV